MHTIWNLESFRPLHLKHFAYFSDPESPTWCHERERSFRRRIGNGCTLNVYRTDDANAEYDFKDISEWVYSPPKPCGVMLSADHVATTFFSSIRNTGFSIPGDLFIASVDNDEQICLNMRPN